MIGLHSILWANHSGNIINMVSFLKFDPMVISLITLPKLEMDECLGRKFSYLFCKLDPIPKPPGKALYQFHLFPAVHITSKFPSRLALLDVALAFPLSLAYSFQSRNEGELLSYESDHTIMTRTWNAELPLSPEVMFWTLNGVESFVPDEMPNVGRECLVFRSVFIL